jgi:hypothetical protein
MPLKGKKNIPAAKIKIHLPEGVSLLPIPLGFLSR